MGANILLVDELQQEGDGDRIAGGIYLYTHYREMDWPERLRQALDSENARQRYDDPQYLSFILIDQVFVNYRDKGRGAGISTQLGQNTLPILVVDLPSRSVAWAKGREERDRTNWFDSMSFDDFVALAPAKYPRHAVAGIIRDDALAQHTR